MSSYYALHLTLRIKEECDFKYFGYSSRSLKHKEILSQTLF